MRSRNVTSARTRELRSHQVHRRAIELSVGREVHELGITRNIVAIVCEQAGDRKVKRVTVDIGKLSAIMPDAIRFCFDICCQQTQLEGAQLEIREIDGRGRCRSCGAEVPLEHVYGRCECGSRTIDCIAGNELMIREMEVF